MVNIVKIVQMGYGAKTDHALVYFKACAPKVHSSLGTILCSAFQAEGLGRHLDKYTVAQ